RRTRQHNPIRRSATGRLRCCVSHGEVLFGQLPAVAAVGLATFAARLRGNPRKPCARGGKGRLMVNPRIAREGFTTLSADRLPGVVPPPRRLGYNDCSPTGGQTMTYEASLTHVGHIRNHWGWFLALGIIFIIGGVIAIAEPLISGVFIAAIVGIAIAIVGVMQIVQAWQIRSWGGFALQLVIGILLVVGGLDIWWNPIEGLLTLTLFVAL